MVNIDILNFVDVVTQADIESARAALETKRSTKLQDIIRFSKEGNIQCAVNSMSQFDKCDELIKFLDGIKPIGNYIESR